MTELCKKEDRTKDFNFEYEYNNYEIDTIVPDIKLYDTYLRNTKNYTY